MERRKVWLGRASRGTRFMPATKVGVLVWISGRHHGCRGRVGRVKLKTYELQVAG